MPNQFQPSSAEVHVGKPLPARQRHVNRTASVDTPAILVKSIKKTTVKKDQEALFSRWATCVQRRFSRLKGVKTSVREGGPSATDQTELLVMDFATVANISCWTVTYELNDLGHFKDVAAGMRHQR